MRGVSDTITDALMPEVWSEHRRGCASCKQYIDSKPSTLAHVCIQGAPMIKRLLEIEHRPEVQARRRAERKAYQESEMGKHKTTSDKVRRAMRYKGDE